MVEVAVEMSAQPFPILRFANFIRSSDNLAKHHRRGPHARATKLHASHSGVGPASAHFSTETGGSWPCNATALLDSKPR